MFIVTYFVFLETTPETIKLFRTLGDLLKSGVKVLLTSRGPLIPSLEPWSWLFASFGTRMASLLY
jgi:hypothetical protein